MGFCLLRKCQECCFCCNELLFCTSEVVKVDRKMCHGWMGLAVGDLLTGNARLVFSALFYAFRAFFSRAIRQFYLCFVDQKKRKIVFGILWRLIVIIFIHTPTS